MMPPTIATATTTPTTTPAAMPATLEEPPELEFVVSALVEDALAG